MRYGEVRSGKVGLGVVRSGLVGFGGVWFGYWMREGVIMISSELIGLDYITKSLKKIEFKYPILFCGEKGTGKTSLAFKRAEDFGTVKENITQINCSNNRGIDFHRELISNLHKSSLFGVKRTWILDEIHGLTPESQNCWLIPLEPQNLNENTLIIACTTTTEKVISTLLRRFITFQTKTLTNTESKLLIGKLCETNNYKLNKISKSLLIEKSEGIAGLIISNLPKLIDIDDEQEIRYLLELSSLDVSSNILEFFKLIKNTPNWITIRKSLKDVLKTETISNIRMGLINLTASYFISDFYKPTESDKRLVRLYHSLIGNNSFSEKSNLIVAIYNSCGEVR